MSQKRLGKLEARYDHRTLSLANYVQSSLPKAPPYINWSCPQDHEVFANDTVGDCTCAACAHQIEAWTGIGKPMAAIKDSDVLTAYADVSNYSPDDASSDRGAVLLDVLTYFRNTGIAGYKCEAFVSVHPRDTALVKDGLFLFGGLVAGLSLPISAQKQTVWDVAIGHYWGASDTVPGSWGGHAVDIVGYDARDRLLCMTWGTLQWMTWSFLHVYCDELYAVLSADWTSARGQSPSGFDLATLRADLALVSA